MSRDTEDRLFTEWLDNAYEKAIEKFKNDEEITNEDKLIFTLKYQSNHFQHLDIELREEIQKTNDKIDNLEKELRKEFKDEIQKTNDKIDNLEKELRKEFKDEIQKTNDKIDNLEKEINQKFEKLYITINNQTWRMLGGIGLILIFIKIADNLPDIISFFSK